MIKELASLPLTMSREAHLKTICQRVINHHMVKKPEFPVCFWIRWLGQQPSPEVGSGWFHELGARQGNHGLETSQSPVRNWIAS